MAALCAGLGANIMLLSAPAARAAERAIPAGESGGFTTIVLAGALILSISAIAYLYTAGEKARTARKSLADYAAEIGDDAAANWRPTGVVEIDAVARQMEEFHQRLLEKRSRIAADRSEIEAAREHGRVMDLELHHRVNNAMAMIQGIANITARSAQDFDGFRASFNERVQCLSRISTLLVRKSWAHTPLRELVETVIDNQWQDRIDYHGPDAALRSEAALAFGMALHELLTNAEKHGALVSDNGRVNIAWRIEPNAPGRLALTWSESGGPEIHRSRPDGVGHYLIRHVLARQFDGDASIAFDQEGLRATLTAQI